MGSKFGWLLAGALVVLVAAAVLYLVVFPPASPPTSRTTRSGVLGLKRLPVTPRDITGRASDGADDAGRFYHDAIAKCQASQPDLRALFAQAAALEAGRQAPTEAQMALLESIAAAMRQGAAQGRMDFVRTYAPAVQVAEDMSGVCADIQRLLDAQVLYSGILAGRGQTDAARRVLEDTLTMGYQFFQEHARIWTSLIGLSVLRQAGLGLQRLAGATSPADPTKAQALSDLLAAASNIPVVWGGKLAVLRNVTFVHDAPGDIFNIIDEDADPAWRMEAIAALGMVKFSAATRGDQRMTRKLIQRYLGSSDPLEAAAAKSAQDLTIEQYRTLATTK